VYKRLFVAAGLFCFGAAASVLTPVNPTNVGQLNSYLNDTTYIDFSALTDFDWITFSPLYGSVSDGNVTLSFSLTGAKSTVPDTWGTNWAGGGPSYPEGSCTGGFCSQFDGRGTLPIFFGFLDSQHPLTITLSGTPVSEFGFEVGAYIGDVTAIFYGATSTPLTVTATSGDYTQSRILAAKGDQITKVELTTTDEWGPGVGAFRYDPIPEPTTCVLLGAGLLALGAIRRLRKAA
jgi:hypothetical protein